MFACQFSQCAGYICVTTHYLVVCAYISMVIKIIIAIMSFVSRPHPLTSMAHGQYTT